MIQKFFDQVALEFRSGDGAPGAVSFRRERLVPRGGPDGGDGGRGGHIILEANQQLSSFTHLYGKRVFKAPNGVPGSGRKRSGKDGTDLVTEVPLGTVVKTLSGLIIHELNSHQERFIFLKGGMGGRGNVHFKTSVNQKPEHAQKGLPGKSAEIVLEVKLIADVGLVGFPNSGKSTLLSVLTNAQPKIANYPFTTIKPGLGVYQFDHYRTLTIADLPGIIEGAHKGEGMGIHFLKHIERTSYLLYLIDGYAKNPRDQFHQLRYEIKQYSELLYQKKFSILINKIDLFNGKQKSSFIETTKNQFTDWNESLIFFSSLTQEGMGSLKKILSKIEQQRSAPT